MRVAILPTGRLEWKGLPTALERLFPGHTFTAVPSAAEVEVDPNCYPLKGFTDSTLGANHEAEPPPVAVNLVQRAYGAVHAGQPEQSFDLALIVDDLELFNAHQPDRVVQVMRAAALAFLNRFQTPKMRSRVATVLRQQVSFHLAAPMVESWFFGDPDSLKRAGVPHGVTVCFGATDDPERFVTNDPDFLTAAQADCPALMAMPTSRQKKLRPKWLGALPRERHPKGYLQWLCRAPTLECCTTYSETHAGVDALKSLSWGALLSRPNQLGMLRSLIEDLSDALGSPPSAPLAPGAVFPLPSRHALPPSPTLRNL